MKKLFLVTSMLYLWVFVCSAQNPYIHTEAKVELLTLTNIHFKTDSVEEYRIGLKKYGFIGNKYSVLLQARLPADTTYHLLPTVFQSGQSVSYVFKKGSKYIGDSLILYRRAGCGYFKIKELRILVAKGQRKSGMMPKDAGLATALLGRMGIRQPSFPF